MQTISPKQLHSLLQQGSPIDLIDVRSPAEYAVMHVAGARLIPLHTLTPDAAAATRRAPQSDPIYVICHSGGRSRAACAQLQAAGLHVVNVEGGTRACVKADLPVVRAFTLRGLLRNIGIPLMLISLVLGFAVHYLFFVAAAAIWIALASLTGCPLITLLRSRRCPVSGTPSNNG